MKFFDQPVVRDSTPNSSGEILRRLGLLLHGTGLLLGPLLLCLGLFRHHIGQSIAGASLGAAGLALHFTRGRWREPATPAPANEGPTGMGNDSAGRKSKRTDGAAPTSPAPAPDAQMPAAATRPRILLLNAALAGTGGNSERLLGRVATRLAPHADLLRAHLSGPTGRSFVELAPALRSADALVVATGTHWDGWSSPLQKFLEDATPSEVTELWLGKPAAVLVSEHSTGGKGVLSRLQGVLSTYGCWIPPLSGLVISKSAQTAARHAPAEAEDFWAPADLDVVADNLLLAARQPRPAWRVWPVDRTDYGRVWVE